jgi:16S rRNA (guanine527-N7)-methyltransferase
MNDIVTGLDVSRETRERLGVYVALLEKWNPRINLVSPSSLGDVWRRHIVDSAQLFQLLPAGAKVLVDLGSGAGLPGLVLAILGVPEVHLIESDARKCVFLREAARVTGATVEVHPVRIETAPHIAADVVTARALAPLPKLLDYAESFLSPGSSCYFLKGATVAAEIAEARKSWDMNLTTHRSLSDGAGIILQLESIVRERH